MAKLATKMNAKNLLCPVQEKIAKVICLVTISVSCVNYTCVPIVLKLLDTTKKTLLTYVRKTI